MNAGPKPTDRVWETSYGVKMRMPTPSYPYFRLDYTLGGKRHQRSVGTDWQAAWAEASRMDALLAVNAGAGTQQQFVHLAEAWFAQRSKEWSATYTASNRRYLNREVLPAIGHIVLQDLQLVDIEDLLDGLSSPQLERKVRVLVSSILHWGQRRKRLTVPAADLLPDRSARMKSGVRKISLDEVPGEDDVTALFEALKEPRVYDTKRGVRHFTPKPWIPYMVLIAAYCGLRIGEICALRGRHVDGDTVEVENQIQVVASELVEVPAKAGSQRTVVVTRQALAGSIDLAAWLQQRANEVGEDGLLFPSPTGKPWRPNNLRRAYINPARAKAWPGKKWSMHSLRHLAATRALMLKAAPQDVQALLGHSSVRTTLDTYVGHQAETLDRLRQVL